MPDKVVRGPLPVIISNRNPQSRAFQWRAPGPGQLQRNRSSEWESDMHREDLMKPDLLSEIVLLGSASLLYISLLLVVTTALSRV